MRVEQLVEAYANALVALQPNDQLLNTIRTAIGNETGEGAEEGLSKREVLQAKLTALEIRLDMAYSDRLEGRIDASYFDRRARKLRRRMESLRQEIEGFEHRT